VTRKVLAVVASAFVLAVVVAAFTIMQSPGSARLRKADAIRSEDLAMIRNAVRSYVKAEGGLPQAVGELRDRPGGLDPKRFQDPITGAPYGYRVLDAEHFELCARFSLDSRAETGPRYADPGEEADLGAHGPGEQCFRLTVVPPSPR
jgi:hypothetical protein